MNTEFFISLVDEMEETLPSMKGCEEFVRQSDDQTGLDKFKKNFTADQQEWENAKERAEYRKDEESKAALKAAENAMIERLRVILAGFHPGVQASKLPAPSKGKGGKPHINFLLREIFKAHTKVTLLHEWDYLGLRPSEHFQEWSLVQCVAQGAIEWLRRQHVCKMMLPQVSVIRECQHRDREYDKNGNLWQHGLHDVNRPEWNHEWHLTRLGIAFDPAQPGDRKLCLECFPTGAYQTEEVFQALEDAEKARKAAKEKAERIQTAKEDKYLADLERKIEAGEVNVHEVVLPDWIPADHRPHARLGWLRKQDLFRQEESQKAAEAALKAEAKRQRSSSRSDFTPSWVR